MSLRPDTSRQIPLDNLHLRPDDLVNARRNCAGRSGNVVEFSNREELERWLKGKPREWAVVLAARAALRVIPMLATIPRDGYTAAVSHDVILPTLRGMAAAWVAATWPTRGAAVMADAAYVAAARATGAARGPATDVAYAAGRAAEAAATAAINPAYSTSLNRAAASAAFAATTFAIDSFSDIRGAASADASELESQHAMRPTDLAIQELWPTGIPSWVDENWTKLKTALLALGEDWHVWTHWYEARLYGARIFGPPIEALELARVQIAEEIWQQGPKVVNAHIKELIAQFEGKATLEPEMEEITPPKATREELANVVSPAPSLTPDEKLDAGPNQTYDAPKVDADLPNLPIRQRALIQTILSGLPAQSPKHLKITLENYDGELRARGVQPILGLLKDMAAVIEADIGAPNARREWLEAGLAIAFENFLKNHRLFENHFPLDLTRDETYARTPVDEAAATGRALSNPFDEVAKAAADAHKAGMTTDDFVKIVAAMTEHVKVVATLPSSQSQTSVARAAAEPAIPLPTVKPEDRIAPPDARHVSATKRAVLTGIGFFVATYNFLGSTASLLSFPQSAEFMAALKNAIEALLRFLR